jgi:plasmid maintenance system killer protein
VYTYKTSEAFWTAFYALPSEQKKSVRQKWEIFRTDPFDPRLGTHRINRLSSLHKSTVYSVKIEGNLRVVFKIVGSEIHTIDLGTHDIYK